DHRLIQDARVALQMTPQDADEERLQLGVTSFAQSKDGCPCDMVRHASRHKVDQAVAEFCQLSRTCWMGQFVLAIEHLHLSVRGLEECQGELDALGDNFRVVVAECLEHLIQKSRHAVVSPTPLYVCRRCTLQDAQNANGRASSYTGPVSGSSHSASW